MRKQPKTTALMSIVPNFEHFANIGVASGVIIILTQDLHGKGHVVFADRYYTSPRRMEYLGNVDMVYVGQYKRRQKLRKHISKKWNESRRVFLNVVNVQRPLWRPTGGKKIPYILSVKFASTR